MVLHYSDTPETLAPRDWVYSSAIHCDCFFFQGENWTLELSRANPEHKKMKEERKRLTFTVPRDRFGHVKSHSQVSHLSRVVLVSWSLTDFYNTDKACGACGLFGGAPKWTSF